MASTERWVQCFLNNGTTGLLRSLTSEKQFNVSNVSPTIAISYALPSSPRIKVSPQMLISGLIILVHSTHRVNKTACISIYKCFILPIPEYMWTLWDRNRTEQNKFVYIVYSSQHWHIHHITHTNLKLHLQMSRTVDTKYLVLMATFYNWTTT